MKGRRRPRLAQSAAEPLSVLAAVDTAAVTAVAGGVAAAAPVAVVDAAAVAAAVRGDGAEIAEKLSGRHFRLRKRRGNFLSRHFFQDLRRKMR